VLERLRAAAKALKSEIAILASAVRDPRTPWYARALAVMIIAYAVSPIDLIPDFIPILGLLDDLILLPAGLWLVRRLVPKDVLEEHHARIAAGTRLPPNRKAAAAIVAIWAISLAAVTYWLWDWGPGR
jgi:uncharacterized membrane protein YkvA (DUF1232 family)